MGEGTTNLPPGFHFFPSDEELVIHFLYRKAAHLPCHPIIPTIELHYCDPWDLNGKALQGGNYWYFFTHRAQNRETANGYWKPIGVEECITSSSDHNDVGLKKTLIFYVGEPPEGIKTNWIMHEYHLLDGVLGNASSGGGGSSRSLKKRRSPRIESNKWVICRVYESSCGSQGFHDEGMELSCLDEVFLSLDDLDEVSLPN
ncbi:NAC domain-containing protein 104 [Elaeis guineensis]|uniref:NAC domain-containing protein 104 n=1 Tax=Elaeis guineensis var. tenera TaxID=51953 RepID=A0A6I9RQ60_ELAGV|nr:NAC domain-containing protein 104 [Elaeis guineensis]